MDTGDSVEGWPRFIGGHMSGEYGSPNADRPAGDAVGQHDSLTETPSSKRPPLGDGGQSVWF